MSDQFDQLFTRARPTAVSAIRPPGAEAARQTVRLRRRRRNTTIAAAVVLAALGGFFVRPGTSPEPVAAADLTAQAGYALGDVTGPVAVEERGEVRDGWTVSGASYHGEQNLTVVCAGTGTMTLLVSGIPYKEGDPEQKPVEIIRVDVPCSDHRPVPVERRYLTGGPESVEYTIVNSSGTAGFAFRVQTPETGEPLVYGDNRTNPSVALGAPKYSYDDQVEVRGALGPDGDRTEDLPAWIGGRFTVAGACAGVGRLEVTVRQIGGGRIVDTWKLPCQWPPKRHDWKPARGSGDLEVHVKFVSSLPDSITETEYALWFQPK